MLTFCIFIAKCLKPGRILAVSVASVTSTALFFSGTNNLFAQSAIGNRQSAIGVIETRFPFFIFYFIWYQLIHSSDKRQPTFHIYIHIYIAMDFSKESYDAIYTKVYEGVYCLSETHRPHHKDSMPELNNRGFLFEVGSGKEKHLLMSGLPGSGLISNVQQLEKDTGLKLTEIVTSGDFHHMATKGWYVSCV